MEYRLLGKTGLKVSELCLGTMTFGRETDEATSHRILDSFVDTGGNFLDTADVYTTGASESIIGKWLNRSEVNRDDLVLATKVRFPMGDGPNDAGLGRKHILKAVEASLNRLQTDYIDLYQVHCWDPLTPLEETLSTLDGLVQQGVVRYLGVSNFTGYQLQRALDLMTMLGLERFVSLQPQYNLLERGIEHELVPVCLDEGLGIIPWSPLRGGWLSGKFYRGMTAPPGDSRISIAGEKGWSESWDNYANESTWSVVDVLLEVAGECGKTPAQVALNWVLNRPGVTAPIIGARTMEQLQANTGSVGWALSADHRARLDAVSNPPSFYPYEFIRRLGARD